MMPPNEGQRPSRLLLDRYATGELDDTERAHVEANLDDRARAHLDAVEAARGARPAPDWAAVRRRAEQLPAAPSPLDGIPEPANDHRGFSWLRPLLGLAVAAAALLLLVPRWLPTGPEGTGILPKAGEALELYQLDGEVLIPYRVGTLLGEGDVIGFRVTQFGRHGVVVLSVDGNGVESVFYPESGDRPEPLEEDGRTELPGSVTLDGAPGPEVFVAVFDAPVSEARAELRRRFREGGADGVLDWAEAEEGVVAVEVERR